MKQPLVEQPAEQPTTPTLADIERRLDAMEAQIRAVMPAFRAVTAPRDQGPCSLCVRGEGCNACLSLRP